MLTLLHMTNIALRPSCLIFSCLAAFALASLVGCADDTRHSSTSESSATTLSTDSKDMTPRSNQNSH